MVFFYEDFFPILCLFIITLFLALLIVGLSFFVGTQKPDIEKISAYECGFEPYDDSRKPFNVRFYIIAILFIVFDLEIIFLFPWAASLSHIHLTGFWVMMDFLIELTIGFLYV